MLRKCKHEEVPMASHGAIKVLFSLLKKFANYTKILAHALVHEWINVEVLTFLENCCTLPLPGHDSTENWEELNTSANVC